MKRTALLVAILGSSACVTTAQRPPVCRDAILFDSNRTGTFEVYSISPDGTDIARLTTASSAGEYSRVPDRHERRIAFQSKKDGDRKPQIYVMSCDGTSVARLTDGAVAAGAPAWSPDGSRIAFVRGEGDTAMIYAMHADGSRLTPLLGRSGGVFYPAWSPDGKKVAFVARADESWEIHVLTVATGEVNQLTFSPSGSPGCGGPAWSPDGKLLAFDANWSGNFEIYLMRAEGGDVKKLTDNTAADARPAWSADGKRIVFHSTRACPETSGDDLTCFDLYTMGTGGEDLQRLTENRYFDGHPDW